MFIADDCMPIHVTDAKIDCITSHSKRLIKFNTDNLIKLPFAAGAIQRFLPIAGNIQNNTILV